MVKNLASNKILWGITAVLALIAALSGVLFPRMYDGVFAPEFIPGAWPQDILTVFICLGLLYAIGKVRKEKLKLQVVILGIIGSFFYLYGIFTIERVYNFLYLLYAAIFSLSFWSILHTLMDMDQARLRTVTLPPAISRISAGFAIGIAFLFSILWILALVPLMREHRRIEYLYSIYILDLCFVMPAFLITSVLTLRKHPVGIILLPAVNIVGFFVIFPLGLGEIAKPFHGQIPNYGSMSVSFAFSALMLGMGMLHLMQIHKGQHPDDSSSELTLKTADKYR